MSLTKLVNGVSFPLTPSEIAERQAEEELINSAPVLYGKKESEIIVAFDSAVKDSLGNYTSLEIDSWYKQEAEAKAWTADNTAPVPLISAIAIARGSTVTHLVDQINAKSASYEVQYGGILGKKQKLLDQLYVIDVNDVDAASEIQAISW